MPTCSPIAARSQTLVALAATLPLGLSVSCGGDPPAAPLDHVLLIVVDTLRADHLSCYGYPRATSPAGIDWLASRGVRFAQATAQCSWTAPSMVSLFTGRHLAEERMSVPAGQPGLGSLFARHGYDTAAFVENPLVQNEENGFRRGFESFFEEADVFDVERRILATAQRPAFTFVHWVDPHDPYGPAPEYAHFQEQAGALPAELDAWYQRAAVLFELEDAGAGRDAIEHGWNGYDDDIRLVDAKVQILLLALERSGQLDRSVVVLASDHGEGLWTRPHYAHAQPDEEPRSLASTHKKTHGNQLYDEQIQVPLIVLAPGARRGGVVQEQVENVDVLPTLMELAGLGGPMEFSGQSLVPLLFDPGSATPRDTFSQTRLVSGLRASNGWKLLVPTDEGRELGLEVELYDLGRDPVERNNLAMSNPGLVAELSERLAAKRASGLKAESSGGALSPANAQAMRALGYDGD